jgi:hypothetical protein
VDFDVSEAARAIAFAVEPLAVRLKFERVLLSGKLRYDPAIMCQFVGLSWSEQRRARRTKATQ